MSAVLALDVLASIELTSWKDWLIGLILLVGGFELITTVSNLVKVTDQQEKRLKDAEQQIRMLVERTRDPRDPPTGKIE